MSSRDQSINTLNAWFEERDESARFSQEDDWAISEYRDAFLFSPSHGLRSNLLFLVRGTRVSVFSPALSSIEEAYFDLTHSGDGSTNP